jgi:hypothetical protein
MNNKFGAFALFLSLTAAAGCTGGGSITGSGDSSSISGSVAVSKVFPTSEGENWTAITASSRYYIKGLDLTITGTCSRGIAKIKVGENGTSAPFYSEEATCLNDGSFTWNKTYTGPLDADKTLTLVAYDIADAQISGSADTVDVHVDNVPPAAVVVTTPGSNPESYTGASATYSIVGTCSADTVKITGPYSSVTTPSGVNWTHDVTLIPGSTLDFTYYAWDLAGNQSAGFTQQINWTPSLSLLAKGLMPGGIVTDGASLYSIEATGDHNPGESTDGVSLFVLQTGFNFITNSARQ